MMEVVCAVIRDPAGRVLAAQRPPGKAQAGRWEFPGGKIEPGESPESALAREIEEELGCTLSLGAALTPVDHPYPGGILILRPYLAHVAHGVPVAHEHSALRWVTAEEAATLDWAPADVPVLAEVWRLSRDSPPA
jgi:8-oxo-dGTP diphosphatase